MFKVREDKTTKLCPVCWNETDFWNPAGGARGAKGRIKSCDPQKRHNGDDNETLRCSRCRLYHRDDASSIGIGILSHEERMGWERNVRFVSQYMIAEG